MYVRYRLDGVKAARTQNAYQTATTESADIYGGTTPREAVELLADALLKGDAAEASRYMADRRQDKEKMFAAWIARGKHADIANALLQATAGNPTGPGAYQLIAVDSGQAGLVVDLIQDPQTTLWKIERF
jgi:uncharacterized protein YbaA (DUF1428 family)